MSEERAKELLNSIVDYVYVGNNTQGAIKELLEMGFEPDELIEDFNFSPSNIKEYQMDNQDEY